MKKVLFIAIASTLFLTACKTSSVTGFKNVKETIVSKTWILQDESGNVSGFNGDAVSMRFQQTSELQAVGFSGCNNYFSSVLLTPEQMTFSQVGSTKMACPDLENEQAFLELLSQVNAYEVSGGELKLFHNKIVLLRFKSK